MIEEIKDKTEIYRRELITLLSTNASIVVRYINEKVYMINFQAKTDGKGYTIEDGSDCPIKSFMILMKEYFDQKSLPNIKHV